MLCDFNEPTKELMHTLYTGGGTTDGDYTCTFNNTLLALTRHDTTSQAVTVPVKYDGLLNLMPIQSQTVFPLY